MTDNPLTAEQLQAELDAAKKEIRDLRDELTATQFNLYDYASDERLKRQMTDYQAADLRAALADVTARAERSEAERDRLRAALAPFKELGSHYEAYRQEQLAEQEREKAEKGYTVGRLLDFTEWLERRFDAPFVLADLLRAAAALDGDDADGEAG